MYRVWTEKKLPGVPENSDPSEFKTILEEPSSPTEEHKPLSNMRPWNRILLGVGLVVATLFLFAYDTSVDAGYLGRIHNLGLQQNRTLGAIAGMIMAAVGGIWMIVERK
jgi:hypothetical protein